MSWYHILLVIILMMGIDLLFLAALVLCVVPMGMFRQTAFAVLKRNFAGYFSNPTGYVFLCLFVCFTSGFAFWPPGFFASNLANFDQLNIYLPVIMLVYVPAITMSIWAEEKRQGTDELLLTLPTTDIDIVLGKYFAAVFVFTVALLYSQLCNFIVLVMLTNGDVDIGLLATTYLGYWFVGITMLAIGMIASFLTNNLTVAFVFGVVFNAPLALLSFADAIVSNFDVATQAKKWSLLWMFDTFGRGIVGLGPVVYFLAIVIVALYLCMILIGKRHWNSGRNDGWMWLHYVVRAGTMVLIVVGLVALIDNSFLRRARIDLSESKVSTLSDETRAILADLAGQQTSSGEEPPPIVIDAYVADEVPTEYVQTRYELVNLLQEFDVLGGDRIRVNLHTGIRPFSDEAASAEQRFDIRPQTVSTRSQGRVTTEELILGASFQSGLERVTVPFFDYGMPVEYELIRSIKTVAQEERKKVAVFFSGAALASQVEENGEVREGDSVIRELRKQYDVEIISPDVPVDVWIESAEEGSDERRLRYDAMLVAQPSMLSPEGMTNLLNAIKEGQPIAIFEDPCNVFRMVADTGRRKVNAADITELWNLLQLQVLGGPPGVNEQRNPLWLQSFTPFQPDIVWQDYNPYQQLSEFSKVPELVFVREDMADADEPFNIDSEITAGLEELLLPFPGAITASRLAEELEIFEPLVTTGSAGVIRYHKRFPEAQAQEAGVVKPPANIERLRGSPGNRYVLAARVQGVVPTGTLSELDEADLTKNTADLNVIYVADVDLLNYQFVSMRNQPNAGEVTFRMQNLAFVLNIIDMLAGEESYIPIRKRTKSYRTLTAMETYIQEARAKVFEERQQYEKVYDDAVGAAEAEKEKTLEDYVQVTEAMERRRMAGQVVDMQALESRRLLQQQVEDEQIEKVNTKIALLKRELDENLRNIERRTDREIVSKQNEVKIYALWVPVVPPLVLSLVVFAMRRLRERAGIAKVRLR